MPAFEGDGGKKRKRIQKPNTSAGIALKKSLDLESQHARLSQPTQQQGSNCFQPNNRQSPQFELNPLESFGLDGNQEDVDQMQNPVTDPKVTSLFEYFLSKHYKRKRETEERHWEEVHEGRKEEEVHFCECQPDQIRLIQMGYIGGSPNPLVVVKKNLPDGQTSYSARQWQRTLSSAVDAYREMLRREELLSEELLSMGPMDKLANLCPKCFGPPVPGKTENEPDYIVCLDGNFQHRRHMAASVEISKIKTPRLFIAPEEVKDMEMSMRTEVDCGQVNINVDPCTEQHTAANNVRSASTWAGCDDTGIFGMACRHDQLLRMINIVQSGEKAYYPMTMIQNILSTTKSESNQQIPKKIGFLYDIGCNIEKGILRRNQFSGERNCNQLMFGTRWGMSDGEGMERKWSSLSPLISQLRYSTKNHRLVALDLSSTHHNEIGKIHALKMLLDRGKEIEKVMLSSKDKITQITIQHGHTVGYLQEQWMRQRECQLSVMETDTERKLKAQVEELVDLEDKIREAHEELVLLQRRRRNRTEAEKNQMEQLPNTLVSLEEEIENVLQELGSQAFRNLPGASDAETKLLIKLKISKAKLYEAKVGTRVQARFKKLMNSKIKLLKNKWISYNTKAQDYNNRFSASTNLDTPNFEAIKKMNLDDVFWNSGLFTHPQEPWAVEKSIQEGIEAYLIMSHSQDELRRIAREARQAVQWGVEKSGCLERISEILLQSGKIDNLFCSYMNG
ncbi:hypothetical protein PTTG_02571 [Puccinia triticina 1-1 BBBD Race 1]|uniref:CxC1 domain-containing protein n=1 Tax=Puccinia triticina (isolate 1-1 / race 1 (BBBD)) TaxID=630390 RepID=A0A180GH65_PUCT1|nr:hypothetical protein PTTG_02571 [Puccinia triticina 1-1 BBBD Race 1]